MVDHWMQIGCREPHFWRNPCPCQIHVLVFAMGHDVRGREIFQPRHMVFTRLQVRYRRNIGTHVKTARCSSTLSSGADSCLACDLPWTTNVLLGNNTKRACPTNDLLYAASEVGTKYVYMKIYAAHCTGFTYLDIG